MQIGLPLLLPMGRWAIDQEKKEKKKEKKEKDKEKKEKKANAALSPTRVGVIHGTS